MKLLVVIMLVIGIVMVISGYQQDQMKCPPAVIKYKYIPRDFSETQNNMPKVSDLFKTMFTGTDPLLYQSG